MIAPVNQNAISAYSNPMPQKTVAQPQQQEHTEKEPTESTPEKEEVGGLKSFAHGVFGLDDPKQEKPVEEEDNDAYFAGKFLKGVGTLGSIIAIIV